MKINTILLTIYVLLFQSGIKAGDNSVEDTDILESNTFTVTPYLNYFYNNKLDDKNSFQANFNITYGIADLADLSLTSRFYQALHGFNKDANIPDDLFINLKHKGIVLTWRGLIWSNQLRFRIPLSSKDNYPLYEYASGEFEYGIRTILSLYMDPYLPKRRSSIHFNAGFYNYNDSGKDGNPATALDYGIRFSYPTYLFNYNIGLEGKHFINEPAAKVFSRYDFTWLTSKVKYRASSWLNLMAGFDYRLSVKGNKKISIANQQVDAYPGWKIHFGFSISYPFKTYSTSSRELEREQYNRRVEFFQKIIEDREGSENIKEELAKLQEEREASEKELEELKDILGEEGGLVADKEEYKQLEQDIKILKRIEMIYKKGYCLEFSDSASVVNIELYGSLDKSSQCDNLDWAIISPTDSSDKEIVVGNKPQPRGNDVSIKMPFSQDYPDGKYYIFVRCYINKEEKDSLPPISFIKKGDNYIWEEL